MVVAPRVYIPIRGFAVAKQRLEHDLDATARVDLATGLAAHTVAISRTAGVIPIIVSSSSSVRSWAAMHDLARLDEPSQGGLNGAANTAVEHAGNDPWVILHSDLPLLTPFELRLLYDANDADRPVVAPSYDGGTSAIAGYGSFRFSYGPGSFQRHISNRPRVVTSLGFLLDIDRPDDLIAARHHPRGKWLDEILGAGPAAA